MNQVIATDSQAITIPGNDDDLKIRPCRLAPRSFPAPARDPHLEPRPFFFYLVSQVSPVPETTLLYQVVQEYWPEFQAELASHGKYLPAYVTKEFDEYLKCGKLEHG